MSDVLGRAAVWKMAAIGVGFGALFACGTEPGPAVVSLYPIDPYAGDTITVSIDSFASDGSGGQLTEADEQYNYAWFREGERLVELDSRSVAAELGVTAPGQAWRVIVTPKLGSVEGPPSSIEFVINTPPTASVELPETVTRSQEVTLSPLAADDDGDKVEFDVVWSYLTADGSSGTYTGASGEAENTLVLPVDELGDVGTAWTAEVTPYTVALDEAGNQKESAKGEAVFATTTIVNTPPVLSSVLLSPDPATASDQLTVVATAEDLDADGLLFDYSWEVDGVEVALSEGLSETEMSQPAGLAAKWQEVVVTVSATDGYDAVSLASNAVTLDNASPTLADVTLTTGSAADILTCTPGTTSDADGDAVYATYQWLIDDGQNPAVLSPTKSATLAGEFQRGDTVTCTVTPDDLDAQGFRYGTPVDAVVVIENAPPTIGSAHISPAPAVVGDTLECAIVDALDVDGDTVGTAIEWTVGGVNAGTGTTLAGSFVKGDEVTCSATPNDGFVDGQVVSDRITISNSPPEVTALTISPSAPTVEDSLTCTYDFMDADGDQDNSSLRWLVNGSEVGTGPALTESFVAGDTVTCEVSPNDGTDAAAVTSTAVSVANTPPAISAVSITPDPATSADSLVCTYQYEDVDGDFDQSTIEWAINGVSAGSGDRLNSGFARGDTVTCSVTGFDGEDAGNEGSTSLTIANQIPTVSAVSVTPGAPQVGDTLRCTYSFADGDGDSDASSIAWTIGGVEIGTGDSLSAGFAKADEVLCTVTANDGTDGGNSDSASVTVSNTAPVASAVTISPASPTVSDALDCTYSFSDADGDADDSTVTWSVAGIGVGSGSSLVSGYAKDDVVSCEVRPNDGEDDGLLAGTSIVIQNSIPSVSGVSITPNPLVSGYATGCDWVFSDADAADSDQSYSTITVNGLPIAYSTVSAGMNHACALGIDGQLLCWGDDSLGYVSGAPSGLYTDVAVTSFGGCAIDLTGGIVCWGDQSADVINSPPPASDYVAVDAAQTYACALDTSGGVSCWGDDDGIPEILTVPQTLGVAVSLSTSQQFACAVDDAGAVRCWGPSGTLAVDDVPNTSNFVKVSAGDLHACALDSYGFVTCWEKMEMAKWANPGKTTPMCMWMWPPVAVIAAPWGRTCGSCVGASVTAVYPMWAKSQNNPVIRIL